ncbi:MAG: hypothetical protein HQ485_00990 [Acidobacteria bacterium]|jgi:hypothetical protein|nr:hypothetical protein [Acidobacteriota bacterium]
MSVGPADCVHLTTDVVREIHQVALLESAVAAPQASVGGQALYADLVEVAAASLW